MTQMDPNRVDDFDVSQDGNDRAERGPVNRERVEIVPPGLPPEPVVATQFRVDHIEEVVELAPRPKPSESIEDDTQYRVMEEMVVGNNGYAMRMRADSLLTTATHPQLRIWVDAGMKVVKAGKFSLSTDSLGVQNRITYVDR